jgi:hypothetical protein
LFEGTNQDNFDDMDAKGRDRIRGSENRHAKLTDAQVREIRRNGQPWVRSGRGRHRGTALLVRRLARRFGVSTNDIKRILRNELWRWSK